LAYLSAVYLVRISQKVLFLCNLCWLAGLLFRVISLDGWPSFLVKSILVMGWLVAFPLGVLWYVTAAVLFFSRKIALQDVPRWLLVANLLFIPAILVYRLA
jgi:hypothetical protein